MVLTLAAIPAIFLQLERLLQLPGNMHFATEKTMNTHLLYDYAETARFDGYQDLNGQYIPFETADEVFSRARAIGARVLLRLELTDGEQLRGMFYTNDQSLCS